MSTKEGPETRLLNKMRRAGKAEYGVRLVVVKYHGSEYSEAGVSDLLCTLDGVFVACEVKAPESYDGSVERALRQGPTLKQRAFVRRVLTSRGTAGFAATEEQFMSILACAEDRANGYPAEYPCLGHHTDPDNPMEEGCPYG